MIHICNAWLDVAHAATQGSPSATESCLEESSMQTPPLPAENRLAEHGRRWLSGSPFRLVRARAFGLWAW